MFRIADFTVRRRKMMDIITCETASISLLHISSVKSHILSTMKGSNVSSILDESYENAISSLNSLQSNSSVLQDSILRKHSEDNKHINDTLKYLLRVGVSMDHLNKLAVIHVSGTKGKGSTCAMIESILRSNGYRTGFFSSPHLVSVKERVRLNGMPLSRDKFRLYFWRIYKQLLAYREHSRDMPSYFCFLTILALDVFLRESVDVCVIEVGIGGRYDCTNVLPKTGTVGITSLGLEHTKLLGNTLEEIAWQKAGIIKRGSDVFSVVQPSECMEIIREECRKLKANLFVVPSELKAYQWAKKPALINESCDILDILELNTSLAIQIATNWMNKNLSEMSQENIPSIVTEQTVEGIDRCFWPGRLQRILYDTKKTLYLDGAHTLESIHLCARWYKMKSDSQYKRLLIFNTTGDRDSVKLLCTLSSMIKFDAAFFTPSVPRDTVTCVDAINHNFPFELQLQRCRQNYEYWNQTIQHKKGYLHESIESVFKQIDEDFVFKGETCDILITGSIHLIGAAFVALNLERFMYTSTTK
ncbi:folylpolyglutamate synthase, mitochondrial isoform X1 [Anopheles merus]|uniref:folylpolyglutamate synthase, mitochondrial isoform X1 n=3 Tax=Anopheles merus TaxID=30066 RepID=UPI001BE49C15|nr:folylpolyglutamate synthase, mitochondrial isoform X1 [Anopheles merus]XP_041769151.1 folylpolyglutamate synthase, mitochondrial isoform X1 [Anopheles merus]XP_041769152.1 folylpolyglutamate synthase, mitochondrial isoform X1 [Anopheles merus]